MRHNDEITIALPSSLPKLLAALDATGQSRRARERREARKPRVLVARDNSYRRRGQRKNLTDSFGVGTLIAQRDALSIVRLDNGMVIMLRPGQYSVGA